MGLSRKIFNVINFLNHPNKTEFMKNKLCEQVIQMVTINYLEFCCFINCFAESLSLLSYSL